MMAMSLVQGYHQRKSKQSLLISDMLSDYGTTPAAVRKQIEHYLVKSGDTGFGLGDFFMISRHVCTSTFN